MKNLAIAHKDYDVYGGGEVLAEDLARTFECPLFVGHGGEEPPEDVDVRVIAPDSPLHKLMDRGGALRGIGHMLHWRDNADAELSEYDTVITSGNEPLWWLPRDDQTVIAYTHSTPRWMYDLHHDMQGFVGRTYNQLQRRLYEGTVKRPDLWVANSELIARRIKRYWNVPDGQIRVVYPPVPTREYDPNAAETEDYYLYLGRLAGHKRVGEVVDAFAQLDRDDSFGGHLVVAGKGPEREALEAAAPNSTEFLGFVSEQKKRELYAGARAVIYPAQNEDFGMVPVEAMAAGTPVIGVDEGFTRFQIQDEKNGLTYSREDGHLRESIRHFDREGVAWSSEEIAAFARKHFSVQQFRGGMRAAVDEAEELARIETPWMADEEALDREQVPARADGGES